MHYRESLVLAAVAAIALTATAVGQGGGSAQPNILFAVADDWSWPHASAYGDPVVQTPTFDRIAAEGVLFTNAFAAAPSCSASRAAILTGQDIWRLQQGANLWGTLPASYATYPDLLRQSGYHIGSTEKGWSPGNVAASGRAENPAGTAYPDFNAFLSARPPGAPFCFWLGSHNPHRPYVQGSGVAAGLDPNAVVLPGSLPGFSVVRSDFCDYLLEVQAFDNEVDAVITALEAAGELDNTIVVITSDNGLPFPRGKTNLYDTGTRVPLAVRWADGMSGGRTVTDFVNLRDIALTFLEAAGVTAPPAMTGSSFLSVLTSGGSGRVDPTRDRVFTGRERHLPLSKCRPHGFPIRALRTDNFLFVSNLQPTRRPAGVGIGAWSYNGRPYADIDPSPTKDFLMWNAEVPVVRPYFQLGFGMRPAEELYDLQSDPEQLMNVASDPTYSGQLNQLRSELWAELTASGDPRTGPGPWAFDSYRFLSPNFAWPNLTASVDRLSLATGGSVSFGLDIGPGGAGFVYLVLGSMTGRSPGIPLPGLPTLQLNPDPYFSLTAENPNTWIMNSFGTLDPSGMATATLPIQPGQLSASAIGLVMDHAFVVADAGSGVLVFASNPCGLVFDP